MTEHKVMTVNQESPFAPLHAAVLRLEEVLAEETEALRAFRKVDYRANAFRKSHCYLELVRCARGLPLHDCPPQLKGRIVELRKLLGENLDYLEHHLAAVTEITDVLAKTMQAHESDSTYAPDPAIMEAVR